MPKILDSKWTNRGEGENTYKQIECDPDSESIGIPSGIYTVQKLAEKKTDKYTQYEGLRVWMRVIEDPDADCVTTFGAEAGLYYWDLYRDGKVTREYDKEAKKYKEVLSSSEHGQYLYRVTLDTLTEGKTYAGRLRMEKHAGKYTSEKPLWIVSESDESLVIPNATYTSRGSSGQTRSAAIQDTLDHAVRLLGLTADTDIYPALLVHYSDKDKAMDAFLSLLH